MPAFALGVSDGLSRSFREVDIETSVDNGRLMAYLAAHGEILARSYRDAPEVDGLVVIPGALPLGKFATVRITGSVEYDLIGEAARA